MVDAFFMIIVLAVVSMIFVFIIRNRSYEAEDEGTSGMVVPLVLLLSGLVVTDFLAGGNVYIRLLFDLMLVLLPLIMIASSVWNRNVVRFVVRITMVLQVVALVYSVLCAIGLCPLLSDDFLQLIVALYGLIAVIAVSVCSWRMVSDIREVVRCGTVWNALNQCVDSVYFSILVSLPLFLLYSMNSDGLSCRLSQALVTLMTVSVYVALMIRVSCGTVFVVMADHERRIIESMKISNVEIMNSSRQDNFKELYDRILEYFEDSRPYLDKTLTINDLVKVVFSNKVYISRAISQYTGRNFCQFVNYYRITYSVECFRNNPSLKITELAQMSGFNTVVSYNMAFRLFMNENPSEWCRKERYKLMKCKN